MKTATQSDTDSDGAMEAVDGLLNTYTRVDDNMEELPSWQVQLNGTYVVEAVIIIPRTGHTGKGIDENSLTVYAYVNDKTIDDICVQQYYRDDEIRYNCNNRIASNVFLISALHRNLYIVEVQVEGYEHFICVDTYDDDYYYGPACLLNCNCEHQCDSITGECPGGTCKSGFRGTRCNECQENFTGENCDICLIGHSLPNCAPCDMEHWGENCQEFCHCTVACDKVNGECSDRCDPGYHGPTCQNLCSSNTWGINCENDCHCKESCNPITGDCTAGCVDGYYSSPCVECETGFWGEQCLSECNCEETCRNTDGYCSGELCVPGFYGWSCDTTCDNHKWGNGNRRECEMSCNCYSQCDPITGVCPSTAGCIPGYKGSNCQDECDDGEWGSGCSKLCNCKDPEEICRRNNGDCQRSGCADWYDGTGCEYRLPSLKTSEPPRIIAVLGRLVTLQFQQWQRSFLGDGNVSYYKVEYNFFNNDNEWEQINQRIYHESELSYVTVNVTLHNQRTTYGLRISPKDKNEPINAYGEPSPAVNVTTKCDRGMWGPSCRKICPICEYNIVCDQDSGLCTECAFGKTGEMCEVTIPSFEVNNFDVIVSDANVFEITVPVIERNPAYTVQYIFGYKLTNDVSWHNSTLYGNRRKRSALIADSLEPNALYSVRLQIIITDNFRNKVITEVEALPQRVETKCGTYLLSPLKYPDACSNWCQCGDTLCLKTDLYCNTECNTCAVQLPDPGIIIVDVTPFGNSIELTIWEAVNVETYEVYINVSSEEIMYIAKPGVALRIGDLLDDSEYGISIIPLIHFEDTVIQCRHIQQSAVTLKKDEKGFPVLAVVIPIVLICLLSLIIAIIVLILKRKRNNGELTLPFCISKLRQKHRKNEYTETYEYPMGLPASAHSSIAQELEGTETYATDSVRQPTRPKPVIAVKPLSPKLAKVSDNSYSNIYTDVIKKPIMVQDLEKYIQTMENKPSGFENEYKTLKENTKATTVEASATANFEKHRFFNILAYDHSRVVLDKINGEENTDYINASYIDGYGGKKREFVASQAPRKCTIDDMWRMIWKLESNIIVMLTNLEEGNRVKCQPYWPVEDAQETFMDITVELIDTSCYGFYIHRHLLVTRGTENRRITHLQFTQWPDHGVPITSELLEFFYNVKAMEGQRVGPLLVHCSAGVGRTGSFIALDYLLKQARKEGQVDVVGCVSAMRRDRTQMIQAHTQYRFVFMALLEALTTGNTSTKTLDITDEMFEDMDSLQKRYDNLEKMRPELADEDAEGFRRENRDKNRDLSCVPLDSCTLYLLTPVEGCNQYINAVMCDTYNRKSMLILTQLPLPHTIPDVWRLAVDHSAAGIVLLEDEVEDVYWPQTIGESCQHGPISVKFASESSTIYEGITSRTFTVKPKANASEVNLKQWHVKISDEELQTADGMNIWLQVYQIVSRWMHIQEDVDATVILQCRNGARMSGMFAALWSVLEKMTAVGVLDVDFAVKRIRRRRPEAIANLEQYHLLHRMAKFKMEDDTGGYYNTSDIASLENSL